MGHLDGRLARRPRRYEPRARRRRRPPVTDRFEGFFRGPIAYGAPGSSLSFDLATAERPVAGGNAHLARANDRVLVER